jgi:hypothetical protein
MGNTDLRSVAYYEAPEWNVSTIFLGIDHALYDDILPILFETMVFGGPLDHQQFRTSNYEQAEAMHRDTVKMCIDAIANEMLDSGREASEITYATQAKTLERV